MSSQNRRELSCFPVFSAWRFPQTAGQYTLVFDIYLSLKTSLFRYPAFRASASESDPTTGLDNFEQSVIVQLRSRKQFRQSIFPSNRLLQKSIQLYRGAGVLVNDIFIQ